MWTIEVIPSEAHLYYRVHQSYFRDGELIPGVFQERGKGASRGMSTDWEKYSTPKESRDRAKVPEKNGIVSFIAGELRHINLKVVHAPAMLSKNRAHTNVKGVDVETRLKLLDMFQWEIPLA